MKVGLALPQYDYSVAGEPTLQFATVVDYARAAVRAGADSLWLSDHFSLDLARYGGDAGPRDAYDPLVTLAALAAAVPGPRFGTLVLCEALRPASVLAHALASLDRACGGRLAVGLGAGWHEPDYAAVGMTMPPPGVRLARLRDAVLVVRELLGGGEVHHDGVYHGVAGGRLDPAPLAAPRPPLFLGGKGDRLLALVADVADGWNTCWRWTPDDYAQRARALDDACARVGRDPATVSRSLGLFTLVGTDRRDLEARFRRLRTVSPAGTVAAPDVGAYRPGRLVGTPEEVAEQVAGFAALGVDEIIVGVGSVPFAVATVDDVELAVSTVHASP